MFKFIKRQLVIKRVYIKDGQGCIDIKLIRKKLVDLNNKESYFQYKTIKFKMELDNWFFVRYGKVLLDLNLKEQLIINDLYRNLYKE